MKKKKKTLCNFDVIFSEYYIFLSNSRKGKKVVKGLRLLISKIRYLTDSTFTLFNNIIFLKIK